MSDVTGATGEADVTGAEIWRSFCDRLASLGERVLADAPASPMARAEGVHHLANQVACWLTYAIGHTDSAHPAFFRSSDPVYQWGGPNADQVARRAMIAGDGTYRISGTMGSCEEFILQVKLGATQSGGAGIATEVSASGLGLGPGDSFELILSPGEPTGRPDAWIELHPEASFVHIRDYYFDWQPAEPATFVIERLDTQGTPRPSRNLAGVGAILDCAATEIEHSLEFWSGYQQRMLADQPANTFGAPAPAGRGVLDILYSHSGVSLADGEALVITIHHDDAPMWDVQLYNRPWYEALDFANRVTCLNHRLAHVDHDGAVRLAIANRDPGVANWLDTEGRTDVLATIRWWRASGTPHLEHRVVPISSLDFASVDAAARHDDICRRSAHIAWRYRT